MPVLPAIVVFVIVALEPIPIEMPTPLFCVSSEFVITALAPSLT